MEYVSGRRCPGFGRDVLNAKGLGGERGPRRDVVLLNAGIGLFIAGRVISIAEGLAVATKAVDSGTAQARLQQMVDSSRAEAAV